MRGMFVFKRQPAGPVYEGLLDCAAAFCDRGMLVVCDSIELDPGGAQVLSQLSSHTIKVERVTEWPGTALGGGQMATLYAFRLCAESISVLKRAADRLLAWVQPRLPEDLCFIRGDRAPWLVTSSCQRRGYLYVEDEEKARLLSNLPSLELRRFPYLPGTSAMVRAPGRRRYRLLEEPKGAVYRSLLDAARARCHLATLAVESRLNRRSEHVVQMLSPYTLKVASAAEWPGTRLHEGFEALVYTFRLEEGSCSILKRAVRGLYGWSSLDRPHHLCLLRPNGVPWLLSEVDIRAAYLFLRPDELSRLLSTVPQLRLAEAPIPRYLFEGRG